MSVLDVLAIHGINHTPGEPYGLPWQVVLRDNDVLARVREGSWNSSGLFVGDALFFINPHFREEALERVCDAMLDFKARGGGVVLAHSMGTVLHEQAERYLQTGMPTVYIGTPLTNPFIVPGLNLVGLARGGRGDGPRPISLWNRDDPIVGGHAKFASANLDEREVSVGGDGFGVDQAEHAAALYLATREARNALNLSWERHRA